MSGETNLAVLLADMRPVLQPGLFVFCSIPGGNRAPASISPVMTFEESEGLTLILREEEAQQAGLTAQFRCRMITLEIHSSLDAVGFLAAITTQLAACGIGVNPVSGYYHDHLFVPEDRADEAMRILAEMTNVR